VWDEQRGAITYGDRTLSRAGNRATGGVIHAHLAIKNA